MCRYDFNIDRLATMRFQPTFNKSYIKHKILFHSHSGRLTYWSDKLKVITPNWWDLCCTFASWTDQLVQMISLFSKSFYKIWNCGNNIFIKTILSGDTRTLYWQAAGYLTRCHNHYWGWGGVVKSKVRCRVIIIKPTRLSQAEFELGNQICSDS